MENILEINRTYLLRFGTGETLYSVTILLITEKAYHIRWNNGLESSNTWELKSRIDNYYSVIEDITTILSTEIKTPTAILPSDVPSYFIEQIDSCITCNGSKYVTDTNSTGGKKICPYCCGSGKTNRYINVYQNMKFDIKPKI